MSPLEETLREISRDDGRALAEIGVRAGDETWIAEHAATIASLAGVKGRRSWKRSGPSSFFYRFARRAARTAR